MYMTQSEIVDRYVRRGTSITILAELNATRVMPCRRLGGAIKAENENIKERTSATCQ